MKAVRTFAILAALCVVGSVTAAGAQSVDAFFGFNALKARTGESAFGPVDLSGGFYPSVGGDLILLDRIGFSGEVAWRAAQTGYSAEQQPVRPLFYDFNVITEPHIISNPAIRPEFEIGLGAQSLRFYQGFFTCGTFSGCTDYASSNHAVLHVAAMVKVMVTDHIFLRPEVHYYNIRHDYEYEAPMAWRFGVSLGYNIGSAF